MNFSYLDPDQAQGDVNVYVTLVDENGKPVVGATVVQLNGGVTDLITRGDKGHEGEIDFNQTADSSFDPNKGQVGAYSVMVKDKDPNVASEKVIGLGLPLRRHVSYHIIFQKQDGPPGPPLPNPVPPPPIPVPQPPQPGTWQITSQTPTHIVIDLVQPKSPNS